jgi:hypothetical protein
VIWMHFLHEVIATVSASLYVVRVHVCVCRNPALALGCEWEAAKEGLCYVVTAGKSNCLTKQLYDPSVGGTSICTHRSQFTFSICWQRMSPQSS